MSTDTATPDTGAENRPGMLERPVSREIRQSGPGSRLRGRPELYTAYVQDMSMLNTPGKRWSVIVLTVGAIAAVTVLPNDWVALIASAYVLAIGAIGLNIVTGFAGQVSLGHAFFVGLGAYTAAVMSGPVEGRTLGYGITFFPLWMLAAGAVAALAGLLVAPLALRLKGLYLAIVTLGLVFLGEHFFKELRTITGGPGVGRPAAIPEAFGISFREQGEMLSGNQKMYLLALGTLIVFGLIARNLARSDIGRAFSAVRDRDIAAEVIGVNLTKAKIQAFVISSFYAGVCGSLLFSITGFVDPGSLNLLLSVRFIAMILIGGVATVSGSIMGAVFIGTLSRFSRELTEYLPSGLISAELLEALLYGVLIIGFLILEPRGLFGLWIRIRNYWKGWPFSY